MDASHGLGASRLIDDAGGRIKKDDDGDDARGLVRAARKKATLLHFLNEHPSEDLLPRIVTPTFDGLGRSVDAFAQRRTSGVIECAFRYLDDNVRHKMSPLKVGIGVDFLNIANRPRTTFTA
jgi:hypothetical protein